MKVFISWSGKRSKETAEILSSWIRQVIQAAETWISLDIEKGSRWNEKINKELEHTKVGIICLNKENLTSEWILFEAGALSKTSDAHVCTFLLDINPADIKPPLGQFQHTLFIKEDVKKLMLTINAKIGVQNEKTLPDKDLEEVFEIFWPRLEEKLNTVKKESSDIVKKSRTDREILEEILQLVRANYKSATLTDYQTILDALSSTIYTEKDYDDFYKKYIFRNYLTHSDPLDTNEFYKRALKYYKAARKKDESIKDENSGLESPDEKE